MVNNSENMKKSITREYLKIPELAEYSGISERTLWDLLKNPTNSIPHFRVGSAGRIVRVKRSDFDTWMENQRQGHDIKIESIIKELLR